MSASPPVILHVDDTEVNRYTIGRILRKAGFVVEEAETGEAGILKALAGPDLVLLDIHLPDIDGYEVCRRLRADPRTQAIPIINLTASATGSKTWASALETGADAYLVQPAEPLVLVATIRSLLRTRAAEAEVRTSARLWTATFDAINQAVAVLDAEGRTRRVNRTMGALLQRPPDDLVGTPASDAFPGVPAPAEGWPFERAVATGLRHTCVIAFGERWLEVAADPMKDEGGEITGVVRVITDITDRRRAEADRVDILARERAARLLSERANRLKDEFLATLSHELRTPLNAIVGWTALLRSGAVTPELSARGLETIERNAHLQTQLIADILDVSRIITGKLQLKLAQVKVEDIVGAALETVRPSAAAKSIAAAVEASGDATEVHADGDRLQQVVWNLLSNAIKFTPAGGRVQVRLVGLPDAVEISVTDSGLGIEPEFLPFVFERFRQADASSTRVHGGLGIGLAIVRHLVELHGGTVAASSEGKGRGATFVVRLPRRLQASLSPAPRDAAPASAAATAATYPDGRSLQGLRVLVIEDEPDTLDLVVTVLEQQGAVAYGASTAAAAREHMEREVVDLVLSDVGLPGEDGLSFMRWLRARAPEQGGQIPAAALTAYAREQDRQAALHAGFQAHLAKPVQPFDLVALVARLAGRAE